MITLSEIVTQVTEHIDKIIVAVVAGSGAWFAKSRQPHSKTHLENSQALSELVDTISKANEEIQKLRDKIQLLDNELIEIKKFAEDCLRDRDLLHLELELLKKGKTIEKDEGYD